MIKDLSKSLNDKLFRHTMFNEHHIIDGQVSDDAFRLNKPFV